VRPLRSVRRRTPRSRTMLELPVHRYTKFVLVSPHYPENVGACARALKTMGFTRLGLVRPSRLALPSHPMARKMAVKSLDVLDGAEIYDNVDEAIVGSSLVVATSARRGLTGVKTPRGLAAVLTDRAETREHVTVLFGNEKTGLTNEEMSRADLWLRVPLAADQPSLNLAQAVQVVAYELFIRALEQRASKSD
jgi:TrmH family RNA methyltransferase